MTGLGFKTTFSSGLGIATTLSSLAQRPLFCSISDFSTLVVSTCSYWCPEDLSIFIQVVFDEIQLRLHEGEPCSPLDGHQTWSPSTANPSTASITNAAVPFLVLRCGSSPDEIHTLFGLSSSLCLECHPIRTNLSHFPLLPSSLVIFLLPHMWQTEIGLLNFYCLLDALTGMEMDCQQS